MTNVTYQVERPRLSAAFDIAFWFHNITSELRTKRITSVVVTNANTLAGNTKRCSASNNAAMRYGYQIANNQAG